MLKVARMPKLRLTVDGGVFLESEQVRLAFDLVKVPKSTPDVVLVSHAHTDHYSTRALRAISSSSVIVMSRASRRIIDPLRRLRNVVEVNAGEAAEVGGLVIEAHEAGHILGSLQFAVELYGRRVVYTGDFNLEKRIILAPAPVLRADVLLIDATYGSPLYTFPERGELYAQVVSEVKERAGDREVMLRARKLGVAQEVTALLAMSTDFPIVVEPEIAELNAVYEEFGEILGRYASGDRPAPGAPLVARLSRKPPRGVYSLALTGWALRGGIPLSSHADFRQLIEYVRRSGAEVVVPFCGFREELAGYVSRELGVRAHSESAVIINL